MTPVATLSVAPSTSPSALAAGGLAVGGAGADGFAALLAVLAAAAPPGAVAGAGTGDGAKAGNTPKAGRDAKPTASEPVGAGEPQPQADGATDLVDLAAAAALLAWTPQPLAAPSAAPATARASSVPTPVATAVGPTPDVAPASGAAPPAQTTVPVIGPPPPLLANVSAPALASTTNVKPTNLKSVNTTAAAPLATPAGAARPVPAAAGLSAAAAASVRAMSAPADPTPPSRPTAAVVRDIADLPEVTRLSARQARQDSAADLSARTPAPTAQPETPTSDTLQGALATTVPSPQQPKTEPQLVAPATAQAAQALTPAIASASVTPVAFEALVTTATPAPEEAEPDTATLVASAPVGTGAILPRAAATSPSGDGRGTASRPGGAVRTAAPTGRVLLAEQPAPAAATEGATLATLDDPATDAQADRAPVALLATPLQDDGTAAPFPESAGGLPPVVGPSIAGAPAATDAPAPLPRETIPSLAAAIVGRAGPRASRFDVALNPEGLGRVDVRLEIASDGRLSAHLQFERPEAAAALGAHAGELQAALGQAGFDVSSGALRFEAAPPAMGGSGAGFAGFGAGGNGAGDGGRPQAGARAFAAAQPDSAWAEDAQRLPPGSASAAGALDIRI